MDNKPSEISPDAGPSTVEKKPYEAPTLLHWGNLRDMTLAVGWSGAKDRGRGKRKGPKRTR